MLCISSASCEIRKEFVPKYKPTTMGEYLIVCGIGGVRLGA